MTSSGTLTNPCVLAGCGEVGVQEERVYKCSSSADSDSYLQALWR